METVTKHTDVNHGGTDTGRACSIPGCPHPRRTRGWCDTHYRQYLRGYAPAPSHWKNGNVGYNGIHIRLYRERGRASDYTCAECGRQALDWAYDHMDPAERINDKGWPYSLDTAHYVPLCRSCHRRQDNARRRARADVA